MPSLFYKYTKYTAEMIVGVDAMTAAVAELKEVNGMIDINLLAAIATGTVDEMLNGIVFLKEIIEKYHHIFCYLKYQ